VIPKRGLRTYKEVWAEEDGGMSLDLDSTFSIDNEPNGTMDMMTDELAETDQLSVGPVLARLSSALRPELSRASNNDDVVASGFDMDIDGESGHTETAKPPEPPATQFPETTWKNVPPAPRQEYSQLDDRILQELKFLALMGPTEQPEFSNGNDDEVAARLRYLQGELRRQSIINGARKAALLEVTEHWMATQEYTTIADDLDNQLNQAYLKRNRNIGKKGKQVKRPGGAGGGSHVVGVSRPGVATSTSHGGIGEPIRNLIDRKRKWNDWIGPVVDFGKATIPKESIFPEEVINKLAAKEQENWAEEQEV
jgi:transcriptional adapter 3